VDLPVTVWPATGDRLKFTLTTATKLTVDNLSKGVSASATEPSGPASQCYVGYWQLYPSSTGGQIPTFSSMSFSGAALGGKPISSSQMNHRNLTLGPTVQIQTGAINVATEGFAATFKHN
jgi:hypothetical protein